MQADHAALLRPIRVGGFELQSRVVMGSMHTCLEGEPARFDELGRFYAERARGGAGLIVTGGFAPGREARMLEEDNVFATADRVAAHRHVTAPVHAAGGRIILQILHAGRYGYHSAIVAPSPIKSPINRDVPRELSHDDILRTIDAFANTARLALAAGYDGVEIMGSEGYLLSQFLAPRTNKRTDEWGGALERRARFPLAVMRAVRDALGKGPILSYRISALELIEDGLNDAETVWLARQMEAAGADCLSTGIGWHEATVPTIAGVVPHAAFADATRRLKAAVSIPVAASNRINLPDVAARLVAEGTADLVSMARPLLADAHFVAKMRRGEADRITVCIACNQACLDHYFTGQPIGCLVNPRALREAQFAGAPAAKRKRVAVIGGGVAGMAAALEAAGRGHAVTLYEAAAEIGGQFRLAARIPGKEDFGLFIAGYRRQLEAAGVRILTGVSASAEALRRENYDAVVIATGVVPRAIDIPGANDPRVIGYTEALNGSKPVGERVVIVGGGGIGHDVALFLAAGERTSAPSVAAFEKRWGIGGPRHPHPAKRRIVMVKRSPGAFGRTLGKSTGWILRQELKDFGVRQIAGAKYLRIDAAGLHIEAEGKPQILEADTIVVCAGQESSRALAERLEAIGVTVHLIGGARLAGELDAKRAMYEGAVAGHAL